MLWRTIMFYEVMCLAGFVVPFVVIMVKECIYAHKTGDWERTDRFSRYMYGNVKVLKLVKNNFFEIIIRWMAFGWYVGILVLNKYYDFLDYDAEQQKEKA